jgi:predicted alpha/beta-fold hydrolase
MDSLVRVMTQRSGFPSFRPHRLLRSPHAQTLAGAYLPGSRQAYSAQQRRVQVSDGDQLVLHDDRPPDWQRGNRVAILVPGLGGCYRSGYMQRIAGKLNARGIRTFRLDQRGWGASFNLANLPFHGARIADLAAGVADVAGCCPGSPGTLIGFSLGANMALNYCGREYSAASAWIDSVVAVCPPLDAQRCVRHLGQASNGLYDRHFVHVLLRHLRRRRLAGLPPAPIKLVRRPRSLLEFDTLFTAPAGGFETVEAYYQVVSAQESLKQIRRPTLLLRAQDDPLAICEDLPADELSPTVECQTTTAGGHLGFIGRAGLDPDRRWMDWRVVEWVAQFGACPIGP